jgi:glycosyltransferase involved in cell wall biosynthesis
MPAEHTRRPTLCIGVLTLNEERRIGACLESAAFADRVIVLDSGSADRTCEIAASLGAEVHRHPDWAGFAEQRNRLLAEVREDYVFFLDADEVITPALRAEIVATVAAGRVGVGRIAWCEVAFGRTLRHMRPVSGVPRLFRRDLLLRFEGIVHEQPVLADAKALDHRFHERLLHHSRETVYGCLQKLAGYVQLGAIKRARAGKRGGILRGMVSANAIFLRMYVFRLGFTGGAQGFLFCFFIALECFLRYAALGYDRNLAEARLVTRS